MFFHCSVAQAPDGRLRLEGRGAIVRAVMKLMRHFWKLAVAAAFAGVPSSVVALGGAAAGPDAGLGSHLVMVLSKQGSRHGACTGTAIAPNIILTAAHCVAGKSQVAVAYSEGGSHVLQRVAATAVNPGFSAKARVSVDLALIRLEGSLPARFLPMTLDRGQGSHSIGEQRRIAGFGLAAERDDASAGTLRSASVSILPKVYPRFMRLGYRVDADLGDFAVCTGDSGGPVLSGTLVVGVVYGREKFGNAESCGTTAQAVRLAPQRAWIDGVLGKWAGQR